MKSPRRSGRTIFAVLCFLTFFLVLVLLVSKIYIEPGLEAAKHLDHEGRRKLAANALLVMTLMLTLLVVGLLITFRISRFFFPRAGAPRTRTKVVDAWAEAGKRLEEKDEEPED